MSPPPGAQPTHTGERVHSVDVLRGVAILGMILVHFHFHSREMVSGVDDLVRTGVWRLVETKSHGMFALLFGAGFAIQMRRADERGAPFALIYLRRLAYLAMFGFAAHALFGFNVLLSYAVWGVPLLLIRRWPTGLLIAAAVVSALSMALFSLTMMAVVGSEGVEADVAARRESAVAVKSALEAAVAQPEYAQLLVARLHHMAWFYAQPFFFLPGRTMALFIVGLLAVRHGVLERPLEHRRAIGVMMLLGVVAWIAGNWLPPIFSLLGLLNEQWLAFTYTGGALLLLAWRPRLLGVLRPIGQAGRMALTNYLLQIAVIDVVFSGYGLHVPEIRPLMVLAATVVLFGAEAVFSVAWLSRLRFGPAEWAWRSLTYGRAQPMRK